MTFICFNKLLDSIVLSIISLIVSTVAHKNTFDCVVPKTIRA